MRGGDATGGAPQRADREHPRIESGAFVCTRGRMDLVFVLIVLAIILALAYGFYSRRGSGIDQHPRGGGHTEDPGVGAGASRISTAEADTSGVFDSRGTR